MSLQGRLIAPYQNAGVKWLLARERSDEYPGGFLCDEMGLGKTVQLIATIIYNPQIKTLIIVPKSIVSQWVSEIKKFAPHLTVYAFDGSDRDIKKATTDIVIAPYSVLAQRPGAPECPLTHIDWDRIILDEGHEIRNKSSKVHAACMKLTGSIKWIVSGTPVHNSIRDFVSLAKFVGIPQNSIQGYASEVCTKYVLRRTKQDLALVSKRLELPPLDFQNLELTMNSDEKSLYETAFTNGQVLLKKVIKTGTQSIYMIEILEALLRIRQAMIWPQLYLDGVAKKNETPYIPWNSESTKMNTLMRCIAAHPKEKALVFTQFKGELEEIQNRLEKMNIPVFRLDGSISKENREINIQGFKDGAINSVFLIQIKSGGVGLNLQEASRVYITSPCWNPATELQAVGRAHRTGQTQKVVVRRLVYKGWEGFNSVEESIMNLQQAKALIAAEVLGDKRLEDAVPNKTDRINIVALKKIFSI